VVCQLAGTDLGRNACEAELLIDGECCMRKAVEACPHRIADGEYEMCPITDFRITGPYGKV